MDRGYLTQNNYNSFRSQAALLVVNTDVVINDAVVTFFDGCIFENLKATNSMTQQTTGKVCGMAHGGWHTRQSRMVFSYQGQQV